MGRLCDDGEDGVEGEVEASGLTRSLTISSLAVSILFISICLSALLVFFSLRLRSVCPLCLHLSLAHSDTLLLLLPISFTISVLFPAGFFKVL